MKLFDLVDDFKNLDDDLMIYQDNLDDYSSDIVLAHGQEEDDGVKIVENKKFYYLIEVFLAKEFIEEWIATKGTDSDAMMKRLHSYAVNDA